MAKTNFVITIGRQFGSGGREVGEKLAQKLGIPYYDKNILAKAAEDSGICKELFEQHDEKPTPALLFSMIGGDHSGYMGMPLQHKLFLAQFDTIRKVAGEGPCVIVGRCADYVLRDNVNAISVFVKADLPARVARAIERGADAMRAEDIVHKADKQRASYYNYYATAEWGDAANYDLCLDTGKLGIDGAVELIEAFITLREKAIRAGKV